MVTRLVSALFFIGAVALLGLMLAVLVAMMSGTLYVCPDGGFVCREAGGAVSIVLMLLVAAAVSFGIGLWVRGQG